MRRIASAPLAGNENAPVHLKIDVRDSGHGMDEATLARYMARRESTAAFPAPAAPVLPQMSARAGFGRKVV